MHPASLLVAALVKLHHPSTRNRIAASMLLARAAEAVALSPAERAACLNLVDELENDAQTAHSTQEEQARRHARGRHAKSINQALAI
jgi:hypothetical protein